jgi:hypothetical protein
MRSCTTKLNNNSSWLSQMLLAFCKCI